MFVSVFLIEPRVHIVIPEKFVYELNRMNLYNLGLNSNQNRRIFFSSELFEAQKNGEPVNVDEYVPNFSLPITAEYPLANNTVETCFIARLKKFWGKCTMRVKVFVFLGDETSVNIKKCVVISF